jgi:ParB family chromosome partitioning protein
MDRKANIAESMGVGVGDGPGLVSRSVTGVPARWQGVVKAKDAVVIPVERIQPDPDQPREEFDPESLDRLAESLRTRGQLQPIRVRWDEGRGAYVIVFGERRWRAAVKAGLATLAAIVVEGEVDLLALQLIENCLREDLKPVEQAKAFRDLMDRNGWSTRRLADELSIHQPQVVQALALLDLPPAVQVEVDGGNIPAATAREIHKLGTPAEQEAMARRVIAEGLRGADVRRVTKGKGKAKASKSRVFRLPLGRLTIDLRKAGGESAMLALVQEVAGILEREVSVGQGGSEAA